MDERNNPEDRNTMSVDDQTPKTLLDLGQGNGPHTPRSYDMTLEEALAQVDAHSTGNPEDDEKLKTLYRILYKADPLADGEQDFLDQMQREAEDEAERMNGTPPN